MNLKFFYIVTLLVFCAISLSYGSVDDVNRLHKSLWEEDLGDQNLRPNDQETKQKPYELNLVSTEEFKRRLLDILSAHPEFNKFHTFVDSYEMNLQIEILYVRYFDQFEAKPFELSAIEYSKIFIKHLQRILGVEFESSVTVKLNEFILDVLLPKRRINACQKYLTNI